jgi:hypothetical protein
MTCCCFAGDKVVPSGMPSLLDPLPDDGQQLVNLVAMAYSWRGKWPVWQYVAQQAFGKHGVDAEAALRNLPQWQWRNGTLEYQAIRMVPAVAGNSSPDIEARTVLTIQGLFHAPDGAEHPLVRGFLKAIQVGASRQGGATLSPTEARPITVSAAEIVGVVNHQASTNLTAETVGLLLSGEPATTGGGVRESDNWTWDLTRYRPLQPFAVTDVRSYLVKLDALLANQVPRPYTAVSPEALPRALDHLNVVWNIVAQQRLFYPRGLAGAASLVESVNSGEQLTSRLGALADIFDLFLRTPTGKSPQGGSLNAFRDQVVSLLPAGPAQDLARAAVCQFIDINRIRNGRLHTDTTNWAESLHRLGVPASESPGQQWDRIRALTVEAVYAIIELLQQLIL